MSSEFFFHSKVFFTGVADSLSIHRILPLVVNDSAISLVTAKILVTNCFLLIGSIFLFQRGIVPIINIVHNDIGNSAVKSITDTFIWFLYEVLWLLPICILCYVCSTVWYQELANHSYKYVKGLPKDSSILKSAGHVIYGTLIWFFTFLQVQLLTIVVPLIFSSIQPYLDLFCSRIESNYPLFFAFSSPFRRLLFTSVWSVSYLLQFCGFAMMCMLYGWYAFDPQWIAVGTDPDTRCGLMERHWAYFIGFGFPYVVLIKSTSFFVGFGAFLAIFPLCIMLGSVSDFQLPYRNRDNKESNAKKGDETGDVKNEQQPMILPVFALSKKWTLACLKAINRSTFQKTKLK